MIRHETFNRSTYTCIHAGKIKVIDYFITLSIGTMYRLTFSFEVLYGCMNSIEDWLIYFSLMQAADTQLLTTM